MKKYTSILMFLVILSFLIPPFAMAQVIFIDPPEIASPEVGKALVIHVKIKEVVGKLFRGIYFKLLYDPTALEFIFASDGDIFGNKTKRFVASIYSPEKLGVRLESWDRVHVDEGGTIAEIRFFVKEKKVSKLVLDEVFVEDPGLHGIKSVNGKVKFFSPADGFVYTLTPTLEWPPSVGATSYEVQIATDDQFTAIVIEQTKIAQTEYTVPAGKLEPNKTYYWRVSVTGTGVWSKPLSFSIVPPSPPALTSPVDGTAFVYTLTPTLEWPPSVGATSYGVQIAMDDKFTAIVIEQAKIGRSYTAPAGKLELNKTYYWRVNATSATGTSAWSEARSFKLMLPPAPTLVSPTDKAAFSENHPTLKWEAVGGVVSYSVQVAQDAAFQNLILETKDLKNTEYPVPAGKLTPGQYWWRVNTTSTTGTGNWSEARSFELVLPPVPVLVSSADKVETLTPTLKWEAVQGTLSYDVQVAKDEAFTPFVIQQAKLTQTSYTLPANRLEYGNTYYWRVRANNAVGTSDWSTPRSFTTPIPPPVLSSPTNKAVIAETLTLKWQVVSGSQSYSLQVAKDEAFQVVVTEQAKLTQTSYTAGLLENNTTYYWRVNVSYAIGTSDWSTPWSFTISTIPPPVLSSPTNKTTLKDTLTPTLRWQASSGTSSYSLQIAKDEAFTTVVIEEAKLPQPQFNVPWGKLENGNTHYWRVNVTKAATSDWSAPWSFTLDLERQPPSAFDLGAPGNGAWTTARPTFAWAESRDTGLGLAHYQLWMDGKLFQDNITKTSYTLTNAQALSGGFHTWTVKAVDKAANLTQAVQTWTVRVDANAPEPFALLAPEHNYQTRDAALVFSWQGSSDAETGLSKYQLYINGQLREDNIPPASNSVELAPLFSIGLSYQIDLDNKNVSEKLRQEFKEKRVSLSQDVVVSIQEIGSNWRINDRGNNKSYLVRKDKDKLHIYYMPSGDYSWYIVAVDKVGYTTQSVQRRVFHILPIDIRLPTAPSLVQPTDNTWTANTTPEFRWNASTDAESGVAKYQFWLDGALLYDDLVELTVALDAQHALSNGAQTWFIKAVDKEGNASQSATWTVNVDILPPEKFSLRAPADGAFANIPTPDFSWKGTSDSGSGLLYYQLLIDGELNLDKIPSGRTTSAPSAPLTEGQHRWFIKAVDKVGNVVQSSETWTIVGEWNPPKAFNLISPTDLQMVPGPRPALSWEPSIDTGAGIERYELWIGGKLNRADIPPTQTAAIPANDLPPGLYQWFVKAVDRAGNVTASKATWTFIVKADLTLPTSTITHPVTGQTVGGTSTLIKGTALPHPQGGELARVEVSLDGGRTWQPAKQTSADFSVWEYVWTNYTAGFYTLRSRAVDKAGNVELPGIGVTVSANLTPPKVSQVKVTPSPARAENILVDVSFISEAAPLNYGVMPTVAMIPAGGTAIPLTPLHYRETKWRGSAQLPPTVKNGRAVIQITGAIDHLGNVMLPDESNGLVIDTQPPSEFNLVEPADGTWLSSKHPNFQWKSTDDTGTGIAAYQLIVDGKRARTTTRTSDSPDFELAVGEHTWLVNAIDKAGNLRSSSGLWRFAIDTTTPICRITAPLPRTTLSDRFYLVQGTTTDGKGPDAAGVATVEVSINDGDWQPAQSAAPAFSSWTYGWEGFKEGQYTLRARAIDRAGNVSVTEPVLVTIDFSLPGIEGITVTPGLAKPGDTVTITLKFHASAELNYAVSPAVILMTADGTPLPVPQESYHNVTWVGKLTIPARPADGIATIHVSKVTDVEKRQMLANPSAGRLAIDTIPPTVQEVSVSPEPAKAGPISVRVTFADATSGVDSSISPKVALLPAGGGKPIPLTQSGYNALTQIWTGQVEVTAEMNDGPAVITVQGAVDQAGNVMPLNDAAGRFTIDVSPPAAFELVSPTNDSWLKGDAVTFTWAASSDKTSGLAGYRLYLNDTPISIGAEISPKQTSIAPTSPLLEGGYVWKVEAVDAAGNAQPSTSTRRFSVDNTPPQTTLTMSESKLNEENVMSVKSTSRFTLAADDGAGSGVASIEYRLDDGKWVAYTEPFTVNVGGNHLLHYRSTDKVGNVEALQSVSLQVEALATWDVNDDGQVDIRDLVLVGLHFGKTIQEPVSPNPDANRDGIVNIIDLVLVGQHFGESTGKPPAAPVIDKTTSVEVQLQARLVGNLLNVTLKTDTPLDWHGFQFDCGYDSHSLTVISVKEGTLLSSSSTTYWHEPEIDAKAGKIFNAAATRVQAENAVLSGRAQTELAYSPHSGTLATLTFSVKDKRVLLQSKLALDHLKLVDSEGRLIPFVIKAAEPTVEALIVPQSTKLWQNYPNPFNPETWIPYELAQDAAVTISIYDIQGRLVRRLHLGHQPAGVYLTKGRTAYWDGRNESGERVASGVYIYQLVTPNFQQTRRMVVVK